jgi:hypothetical protein
LLIARFAEILRDNKDGALPVDMDSRQLDPDFQYGRTVLVVDDDPGSGASAPAEKTVKKRK